MKGKNYIKKHCLVIISLLTVIICPSALAQGHMRDNSGRARHHNFYHKIELNYGNLYSFAASSCLTGVINYLIDDAFFETGLGIPIYREQTASPYSFNRQNMFGVEPRDLIHNFDTGLKLGYQTYNPSFFNFGVCGVAQFKHEPFIGKSVLDDEDISYSSSMSRVLLGGNIMIMFGEMSMSTQVTIEAGLRYSKALKYVDASTHIIAPLNNGLVSHFAISFGGPGYFQNIKLLADITHFKLVQTENLSLSPIYVGLSWTVTPQQSYNKR